MPSYNRVILVGNITRAPEARTSKDTLICNAGIAVNRKYKDKEEVMFIDITAFGKVAEIIAEYVSKGDPVMIEGRLAFSQWEQDGAKRSKHSVIVENMQMLGKKGESSGSCSENTNSSYSTHNDGYGVMSDDDVPF